MIDVGDVPLQHSENCVEIVRYIRAKEVQSTCEESTGLHCQRLTAQLERIYSNYAYAIGRSLFKYGVPLEFDPSKGKTDRSYFQFFDVALIELGYRNCLAEEAARLEQKIGLELDADRAGPTKISTMASSLMPGQSCARSIEKRFGPREP
jgi:hypothetical protein